MVDAVSNLLEKMKRGEKTGVMFIASTSTGNDVIGVYGDFADDIQYAVYASTKHLDRLVTKAAASAGIGHSSMDPMRELIPSMPRQELPRMLRLGAR